MPTGKLYLGDTLISDPAAGGGSVADQWPSPLTADGVDAATSARNTITATASATPHTWGPWTEVDASLSVASGAMVFYLTAGTSATTANTSTLLQIGTGAAAAEVPWATFGIGYTVGLDFRVVPGAIPAGTRVAVRCQSIVVSKTVAGIYWFYPPKATALGAPYSYGFDVAASQGITITAPGSLNTKGAWMELVASTPVEFAAVSLQPQGAGGTGMSASGVLVDLGIGAAAAETVLVGDIYLLGGSTEFYNTRNPLTFGAAIPAGSRLSARYQRANTGNGLDLTLIGTAAA